ncbi:ribosome maturation factor RimM [Arenimonas sp. MALMAid1274]|uniref:ribosome maturation factor RimM n=1 Tax=Arenimonas sp. MALMAid1274 TaxID=3411630 RepID=UPI003BA3D1D5
MSTDRRILLGRVAGDFGVRGELKLLSWTDPREAIFRYQPWILRSGDTEREVSGVRGRDTGKLVIATFPGVENREQAEALKGAEIWVTRDRLPPPRPGEYYWVDLEGLAVQTVEGVSLGTVSHLFDTGANPVIVISGERERLVPFVTDTFVKSVDFEAGLIVVDWDPDF